MQICEADRFENDLVDIHDTPLGGRSPRKPQQALDGAPDAIETVTTLGEYIREIGDLVRDLLGEPVRMRFYELTQLVQIRKVGSNEGERVIDLVGHARREDAYALELLFLMETLLGPDLVGAIAQHDELARGSGIPVSGPPGADLEVAPIAHLDLKAAPRSRRHSLLDRCTQRQTTARRGVERTENFRQLDSVEVILTLTQHRGGRGIDVSDKALGVCEDHAVRERLDHIAPHHRLHF